MRKAWQISFLFFSLLTLSSACELKLQIKSRYVGKIFAQIELPDGSSKIMRFPRFGSTRTIPFSAQICGLYMTSIKTFKKTPRGLDGVDPIGVVQHNLDGKGTLRYEISTDGSPRLIGRDLSVWCAFGKCPFA
ncbi:unnamed protein product, partial [Mesorhabditis belari]|uniref:Uncharacterized protein n=1 Tax=Mesorhabditis belari TaxID=2138241 RepID=A0AAF3JBM7_9BILA